MSSIASIIILAIFIIAVIIVIINFLINPGKAKAVFKNDRWYVSVKRIWWDTCETREEAQEFCRPTLPDEYPFISKSEADKVVSDINEYLNA